MKVLWLNAGLLLPLDKGGKLRTWHLMRHLARSHEITYVSFADGSETPAEREGMREVCHRLETIPRRDAPKGTAAFYAGAARRLLDPVPYAVGKYRSAAYRRRIESLLRDGGYDAVVCDFLVPLVNMPRDLPRASVLFTHNVEAEIWRRHSDMAGNPLSRRLLAQQWRRMLRFERAALSRFDLVLAVSDADAATFDRLYPGALRRPVHVVQTGVDTAYFQPQPGAERPAHLVFTGSMDWLPNEDGMTYFARDILPRIRAAAPDVTLSIVGRAPTPAVRRLTAERGVEVTGRVEDVRPHMAAAAVYVVPLRIGGGTRLKIYEAMAMGKAVVSTTIGAEGLPVVPGRDLVLADGPDGLADAIVGLLRNPAERRRVGEAARRLVVERYDWSAVAQEFEEALHAIAAATAQRAAPAGDGIATAGTRRAPATTRTGRHTNGEGRPFSPGHTRAVLAAAADED